MIKFIPLLKLIIPAGHMILYMQNTLKSHDLFFMKIIQVQINYFDVDNYFLEDQALVHDCSLLQGFPVFLMIAQPAF